MSEPNQSIITVITKRPWELLDYTQERTTATLQAGTHELERIPNPGGYKGHWLVVKGTTTDMAEGAWKQWINGILSDTEERKPINWGDAEIILIEDGQTVPPPVN